MVCAAHILCLNWMFAGHNGISLLPLDPLSVPRISIIQGEESPVNVELVFTNNTVIGLHNFKFYKIMWVARCTRRTFIKNPINLCALFAQTLFTCSGFQEKPEGKYEFRFKGPSLQLVGPYSINGRILILPIQGVGDSNITMSKFEYTLMSLQNLRTNRISSLCCSKSWYVGSLYWKIRDKKWQRVFEAGKNQIIVYNDEADFQFGKFVQWR